MSQHSRNTSDSANGMSLTTRSSTDAPLGVPRDAFESLSRTAIGYPLRGRDDGFEAKQPAAALWCACFIAQRRCSPASRTCQLCHSLRTVQPRQLQVDTDSGEPPDQLRAAGFGDRGFLSANFEWPQAFNCDENSLAHGLRRRSLNSTAQNPAEGLTDEPLKGR